MHARANLCDAHDLTRDRIRDVIVFEQWALVFFALYDFINLSLYQ